MEYKEQGYLILHNKIINEMMDGQQKISNHLNMIKLKDQWSVVWNNRELTLFLLFMINEPGHDFQQCGILNSVDSDEPVQSPFKLRNSKGCSVSSLTLRIIKRLAKALIRLCIWAGWSEPSLVSHTTFLEISCTVLTTSTEIILGTRKCGPCQKRVFIYLNYRKLLRL